MSYIKYKKIEHDLISKKKRLIKEERYENISKVDEELKYLRNDPRNYLMEKNNHNKNSLEGMYDMTESMTLVLLYGKIKYAHQKLGLSSSYKELYEYLVYRNIDIFEDSIELLEYINEDIGEDSNIDEKMEYFINMCDKCDINNYINRKPKQLV